MVMRINPITIIVIDPFNEIAPLKIVNIPAVIKIAPITPRTIKAINWLLVFVPEGGDIYLRGLNFPWGLSLNLQS
jgi:hypothetical protein